MVNRTRWCAAANKRSLSVSLCLSLLWLQVALNDRTNLSHGPLLRTRLTTVKQKRPHGTSGGIKPRVPRHLRKRSFPRFKSTPKHYRAACTGSHPQSQDRSLCTPPNISRRRFFSITNLRRERGADHSRQQHTSTAKSASSPISPSLGRNGQQQQQSPTGAACRVEAMCALQLCLRMPQILSFAGEG